MTEPEGRKPDLSRAAHFLLRDVNRAIREFDMIHAGDRLAVAVSGGKDSLTLLRLLDIRRAYDPTPYEITAIHVRGDETGITAPHAPLEAWLREQGVRFEIVEPALGDRDAPPLTCQRCTWLRRKALFQTAEALGCNVVAYAHHADDAAQTTLLNLLYGGQAVTLAPHAEYFGGHFRLIRPLIYVPERELARFARAAGFPPAPPICPRAAVSHRRRIAEMLDVRGPDREQFRSNLLRAGLRGLSNAGKPLRSNDVDE
jgi:tRNA 2-thiocytidine biosynthesis protein TtcA